MISKRITSELNTLISFSKQALAKVVTLQIIVTKQKRIPLYYDGGLAIRVIGYSTTIYRLTKTVIITIERH